MNTHSLIILVLYALVTQTISFDMDFTPGPYAVNGIIAWTEPNCQGIAASTIFNSSTLAKNISNVCLAHSFQLLRPLQNQEQLDISIIREPSLWYPYGGGGNSLSCTSFIQSYFPVNGSDSCHNTPPFTCHRMWINYGLDTALRGSNLSTTGVFLSTLPTIIPSCCVLPNSTSISASSTTSSPSFSSSASAMAGTLDVALSALSSPTSQRTSSQQKPLLSSEVAMSTFRPTGSVTETSTRTSASSAMYISSYASASTHVATGALSSRTVATSSRSFTQMVRVEPGNPTKFIPQTLDVSIGDTVWFYSLNGSFLLYNTTLELPCSRLERYGDDAYKHVIFRVNSTEPLWFIGIQNRDEYTCCSPAHFALNPGTQKDHFFDLIDHICMNVTQAVAPPQGTTTRTVVVHQNGDVITTLTS